MTDAAAAWEYRHRGRQLAVALVAGAWALVLWAWHRSLRFDDREVARLSAIVSEGRPVVVVFWHGNYPPLFAGFAGWQALVVTGASFRGAVIAAIARHFGYRAVQVTYRPHTAREALRRELASPGGMVAIAVDGPLGPRHVVKSGAVAIAVQAGAQIVPVQAVAASRVELAHRWDRMELPFPFARVTLRVGLPIRCDATADIDVVTRNVARALLDLAQPVAAQRD